MSIQIYAVHVAVVFRVKSEQARGYPSTEEQFATLANEDSVILQMQVRVGLKHEV